MSKLGCVKFSIDFEFSDATCTYLIQRISNLKKIPNMRNEEGEVLADFKSQRHTLRLGRSFQNVSIEKIVELVLVSSERINL